MTTNPNNELNGVKVNQTENEEDLDAVLAALEEDDDPDYRSQRIQELTTTSNALSHTHASGQLEKAYITLKSDDEVLQFTTEHERAVVHFRHPDFARCDIMDKHLQLIANRHSEFGNADVSFGRVDVQVAEFVVEKLQIRVLPCCVGFVQGVVQGRVTGFEGVCWNGKEESPSVARALEKVFMTWKVLRKALLEGDDSGDDSDEDDRRPAKQQFNRRGIRNGLQEIKHDDDDDDWD